MYPNVSICIQIYPFESKNIQMYPNVTIGIQMNPNASKCIHLYPLVSKCIQMYPKEEIFSKKKIQYFIKYKKVNFSQNKNFLSHVIELNFILKMIVSLQ
jgi:hypothetical protein